MKSKEWFKQKSFQAKSYSNINKLIKAKKKRKETISVIIPTLNEEKNIGQVVNKIKTSLIEKQPLVDEIIVIDSGSTDKTKKIAQKEGASFYLASNVLKNFKTETGKGESMWKSLYVSNGSIIVFIDADIKNIHPRFVYGLVGPLLNHEKLKFVKSFFSTPLTEKEKINKKENENIFKGGRISEILVRPLLNMYFPELSRFIQPLSGQIAGRRKLLEQLSFFSGYGVDIGLLIDIYKKYGLNSICQVNLEELKDRHRALSEISKMSFKVLQVFTEKANLAGEIIMTNEIRKKYTEINKKKDDLFFKEEIMEPRQQEPIIMTNEYKKKFYKDGN